MITIDMENSLYHAIMSKELGGQNEDFRYEKLRSILEHGYIYSLNNLKKNDIRFAYPNTRGLNDDDYICIGCNPNSAFSKKYSNIAPGELNGYVMSQLSFGFALDPTLLDELECIPGSFNYEILVRDKISTKYAVGIINAGCEIDRDLIIYDWYMQYQTGEMSKEEYIRRLYKHYGIPTGPGEWYMNEYRMDINRKFQLFTQYVESYLDKEPDDLIVGKERYEKIKGILIECGSNIPIVDNFGCEIPSIEHQKAKVLELQRKYINR